MSARHAAIKGAVEASPVSEQRKEESVGANGLSGAFSNPHVKGAVLAAGVFGKMVKYAAVALCGAFAWGVGQGWVVSPAKRTDVAIIQLTQQHFDEKLGELADLVKSLAYTTRSVEVGQARIEGALGIPSRSLSDLRIEIPAKDKKRR